MYNNADQIIPRLWLGNVISSQDIDFIKKNRITVIINCTKDLPFLDINGVYKYRLPVHDNLEKEEIVAMTKWITKILPVIEEHYRNGRSILIHCAAGIQRSAMVVLSFLYFHYVCDPKSCLFKIRAKRPYVFMPYMNFGLSFQLLFGKTPYQELIK